MPLTGLALTAFLVAPFLAAAAEPTFEEWVRAEALREHLTVSRVGTLTMATGQRVPYAKVESPPRSAVVVEVKDARWVLGPCEEGTDVLEPARDGLAVRVPSTAGTADDLFLDFRGGAPVVVKERFSTRYDEIEFDFATLTRSTFTLDEEARRHLQRQDALLPRLPEGDETAKVALRAGKVAGEMVAHGSQLWMRSTAPARWRVSWAHPEADPLEISLDASGAPAVHRVQDRQTEAPLPAVALREKWILLELPEDLFPPDAPANKPLEVTLIASPRERATTSFVLVRFDPPGRWWTAARWVRRIEGGRIWSAH